VLFAIHFDNTIQYRVCNVPGVVIVFWSSGKMGAPIIGSEKLEMRATPLTVLPLAGIINLDTTTEEGHVPAP
jgi:hypothetical protein